MNLMNLWRASRLLIVVVPACVLVIAGCSDSKSAYQPPTASVNGSRPETQSTADDRAPDDSSTGAATGEPAGDAHEPGKLALDATPAGPPLFAGWPKPRLALVISGRQDGYLEPCGCAGLENQQGGLSRRDTFIKQLEERGWPVVGLDVGGQVRRFGRQAELQFAIVAEALKQMRYGAAGFGPADLRLSAGDVGVAAAGANPDETIFVSANVNLLGLTPKVRILKAGGMTVGVTSILGEKEREQVHNDEVEIQPAADALKVVLPELAKCDVRILLAHASIEESEALAREFPEFALVVTAGGADLPPSEPKTVEGTKSRLVEIGHKGEYVIVAGLFDNPKQPIRFQRVALDKRYPDSPEMRELMATYQDQLQQLGWEGLGLKSVSHSRARGDNKLAGQFVGSASCKECHPTAWGIWSKTKHAHATESLVSAVPPRQFDAECVSCHVTGWNPKEFFPYTTGFEGLDKTPHLAGNGCENCHGPGGAHVAAEKGRNRARQESERAAMKLTTAFAEENLCIQCHDLDNSPNYIQKGFKEYWPKIEHKGKR